MRMTWKYLPLTLFCPVFLPLKAQVPEKMIIREAEKNFGVPISLERLGIIRPDQPTGNDTLLSNYLAAIKPSDEFFAMYDNDQKKPAGYCMASSAPGRFENFEYFILYDTLLTVQKVKVWKYRSSHGGAVAGRRWLRQFSGYGEGTLTYGRDVQAISGATISGRSLVAEVERAGKVMRASIDDGFPANE